MFVKFNRQGGPLSSFGRDLLQDARVQLFPEPAMATIEGYVRISLTAPTEDLKAASGTDGAFRQEVYPREEREIDRSTMKGERSDEERAIKILHLEAKVGKRCFGFIDVRMLLGRYPLCQLESSTVLEEGPTLLVTAGVHACEYAGIEGVIRFYRERRQGD